MRVRVDVYPCSSLIRLIVLALGTGELDTTSSFLPFFVDLASLRGVDAFLLLERLAGSASFLLLFVNSALINAEGAFLLMSRLARMTVCTSFSVSSPKVSLRPDLLARVDL